MARKGSKRRATVPRFHWSVFRAILTSGGPGKNCHSFSSRGTKRLVSANICSVEGNSAGIFVIIFGGIKLPFWVGAIKAQLPFSEGKYQLLILWNKIPFPTIFYQLNFGICDIRREQMK